MLEGLLGFLGLDAGKALKHLFRWNTRTFPPCNAIVLREGRGWPWDRQIVVHTRLDGKITQRLVAPDEAFPTAPLSLPPGPKDDRPEIGF